MFLTLEYFSPAIESMYMDSDISSPQNKKRILYQDHFTRISGMERKGEKEKHLALPLSDSVSGLGSGPVSVPLKKQYSEIQVELYVPYDLKNWKNKNTTIKIQFSGNLENVPDGMYWGCYSFTLKRFIFIFTFRRLCKGDSIESLYVQSLESYHIIQEKEKKKALSGKKQLS